MPEDLRQGDAAAVAGVARLARLRLTAEETARFGGQLRRILEYFDQIREVDTAGVEPLAYLPGDAAGAGARREDSPSPGLTRDEALAAAPEADPAAGLFKVPRVLG